MGREDQPIEVPYRVDGGIWSNEAPALPGPPDPFLEMVQMFEAAGRAIGDALLEAFSGIVGVVTQFVDAFTDTPMPVPPGTQIVKPARGGKTFLAWRGNCWVPVHRQRGVGWLWSE